MSILPSDLEATELSQRERMEIRRVLMEFWDPIGVRDLPDVADEYDSYGGKVAIALRNGESLEKIEEYLRCVVKDWMSISPDQTDYSTLMSELAALRLGA